MSRNDKFIQPDDGMVVISRANPNIADIASDLAAEFLADEFSHPRTLATRETAVHQAADAHLNPMTVAVMYAFLKARKVLKADPKNVTGAMKTLRSALGESLPAALLACLVAGGEATVLPQTRAAELRAAAGPTKMRFDKSNPAAAKWAREHAAELVDGITTTTEERIREAIARGQEGEVDVYDEVLDAIGDEARAGVIARTESMRAANEGQRQMWGQAVDDGLLTGDEQREWITAEDACPQCDELDGEQAEFDGEYPGDGGDGPPLHPNCRCTEGISALRSAGYNKNELRDKYGHWSKGGAVKGVTMATPGGSIPGSESPAVMAALDLLDLEGIVPDIVVAYAVDEKLARSTKGGGSITEGWVDNNDPTKLYIASWSDVYRGAMKGDRESVVRLAGFIAHEQYHMVNGPHEAGAYDRQIEVLTKLGAPKSIIDNVRKAKEYVGTK